MSLILGGASILLGLKPKLGAAVLIGFLAGVSLIMHDFWHFEDPEKKMNEMINFTKNIALLGGIGVDGRRGAVARKRIDWTAIRDGAPTRRISATSVRISA